MRRWKRRWGDENCRRGWRKTKACWQARIGMLGVLLRERKRFRGVDGEIEEERVERGVKEGG
jgi:hypothetical protein